jgi:hypothetical protein
MVKRSDEVQLAVMEALKWGPATVPGVMLVLDFEGPEVTLAYVYDQIGALERDGFVKRDASSSVMPIYSHAREHALSDLRAKLLPSRDPVREGHEFESTAMRNPLRYRRGTLATDLDVES